MKKNIITMILLLCLIAVAGIARAEKVENPEKYYGPESPIPAMMAKFFGVEENQVITLGQNCHYPDDVLVALYLSRAAGAKPQKILEMRQSAESWMSVFSRLKFHPSRMFTPLPIGSITTEYRHAYEQYHRWKANPSYQMKIYDKEFRNLAGLKFMVEKFGESPAAVVREKSDGETFINMIMEEMQEGQ